MYIKTGLFIIYIVASFHGQSVRASVFELTSFCRRHVHLNTLHVWDRFEHNSFTGSYFDGNKRGLGPYSFVGLVIFGVL